MTQFKLNRNVFNKDKFGKTINLNFTELGEESVPGVFDLNLATIEDFFTLYDNLFYEIPKQGSSNSHEFIIQTSNDYVEIALINDEINDLIEEINDLREENLNLRGELTGSLPTPPV